jgi:hypothetical protein
MPLQNASLISFDHMIMGHMGPLLSNSHRLRVTWEVAPNSIYDDRCDWLQAMLGALNVSGFIPVAVIFEAGYTRADDSLLQPVCEAIRSPMMTALSGCTNLSVNLCCQHESTIMVLLGPISEWLHSPLLLTVAGERTTAAKDDDNNNNRRQRVLQLSLVHDGGFMSSFADELYKVNKKNNLRILCSVKGQLTID